MLGELRVIPSDLSLFFFLSYGLMDHPVNNFYSVPSTKPSSPKVLAQCLD